LNVNDFYNLLIYCLQTVLQCVQFVKKADGFYPSAPAYEIKILITPQINKCSG